jgi:hypothetical protein
MRQLALQRPSLGGPSMLPEDLPFRVIRVSLEDVVIVHANNVIVRRAAYETTVRLHPKDTIQSLDGAMITASSKPKAGRKIGPALGRAKGRSLSRALESLPTPTACANATTVDGSRSTRSTRSSSAATSIETDHKPISPVRLERPGQPTSPDRHAWCWSSRRHGRRRSGLLLPGPSSLAILYAWLLSLRAEVAPNEWKSGSIDPAIM